MLPPQNKSRLVQVCIATALCAVAIFITPAGSGAQTTPGRQPRSRGGSSGSSGNRLPVTSTIRRAGTSWARHVLHRRLGRGLGLRPQRRGRRSAPGLVERPRRCLLPALPLHLQLGPSGQQRQLRRRADRLHAVQPAIPVPLGHSIRRRPAAAGLDRETGFGDFQVTPRFLLSETENFSQSLDLTFRTPTGSERTGNGIGAFSPVYNFWWNAVAGLVLRGGVGGFVPFAGPTTVSRSLPIWPPATTSPATTCSRSATSSGTSPPTSTS